MCTLTAKDMYRWYLKRVLHQKVFDFNRVFDLYTFPIQTGEQICIGGLPEKFYVYKLYNFSI